MKILWKGGNPEGREERRQGSGGGKESDGEEVGGSKREGSSKQGQGGRAKLCLSFWSVTLEALLPLLTKQLLNSHD